MPYLHMLGSIINMGTPINTPMYEIVLLWGPLLLGNPHIHKTAKENARQLIMSVQKHLGPTRLHPDLGVP